MEDSVDKELSLETIVAQEKNFGTNFAPRKMRVTKSKTLNDLFGSKEDGKK